MRTGRFTKEEIAFVAKSKLTSKTIASKLNRTVESVNKYKSQLAPKAEVVTVIAKKTTKAMPKTATKKSSSKKKAC
jgi:DNA-binding NarL/FixJ family response regulator